MQRQQNDCVRKVQLVHIVWAQEMLAHCLLATWNLSKLDRCIIFIKCTTAALNITTKT